MSVLRTSISKFLIYTERTKMRIEPLLYKWFESLNLEIKEENILNVIEYAITSPSWRERATIINLIIEGRDTKLITPFLQIGAGIELIQEGFMLRDDILDEQRTCVKRKTVFDLFGQKITNLAVNILLSGGRKLFLDGLSRLNLSKEKISVCSKLFEEMIYLDTIGQWLDLESERWSYHKNLEKQYFKMVSYTPGTQFKNIATIAYLISGKVDRGSLKNIQNWGLNFGAAAQLRDDIIDIIGDEEVVFKKLGTDIIKRKKRLPLIKFLEENPKYRKYFDYRKYPQLPEKIGQEILAKMHEDRCISYCVEINKKIVNKAINYLKKVNLNKKEKEILVLITSLLKSFED